jgi:hypothetical protein
MKFTSRMAHTFRANGRLKNKVIKPLGSRKNKIIKPLGSRRIAARKSVAMLPEDNITNPAI